MTPTLDFCFLRHDPEHAQPPHDGVSVTKKMGPNPDKGAPEGAESQLNRLVGGATPAMLGFGVHYLVCHHLSVTQPNHPVNFLAAVTNRHVHRPRGFASFHFGGPDIGG